MTVTNDIRYIGVTDRQIDLFEGQYTVPNGIAYNSYAILDEKIDLYLAEGLTFGEMDLDEDEFLAVERIPLSTLLDMVMNGEITDGKTQVAILKTCELLRRREEGSV